MNYLEDLGIVGPASKSIAAELVAMAVPDLTEYTDMSPSEFVATAWSKCLVASRDQGSLRGAIFELVLALALVREEVIPFYTQARVELVPNVNFDFILWTSEYGPVAISAKTSLRERYKQADLEAMALSSVHRKSKSFLVTLEGLEAARVKAKIVSGDVLALTDVILATSSQFDDLICELRSLNLMKAPVFSAVQSGNCVSGSTH